MADDSSCCICRVTNDQVLILCDGCDGAYHLPCLSPCLNNVPEGDWLCPKCTPIPITTPVKRGAVRKHRPTKRTTHHPSGDEAGQNISDYEEERSTARSNRKRRTSVKLAGPHSSTIPAGILRVQPKLDLDNDCEYMRRVERYDLTDYDYLAMPQDTRCHMYINMPKADLKERIKLICRRMNTTQSALASKFNFNHGNMSGSLVGSYKYPSSRVMIHTLAQWAFQMDCKFVDDFRASQHFGDDYVEIANRIRVHPEQFRAYLSFEMHPTERQLVDTKITEYLQALNRPLLPSMIHKLPQNTPRNKRERKRSTGSGTGAVVTKVVAIGSVSPAGIANNRSCGGDRIAAQSSVMGEAICWRPQSTSDMMISNAGGGRPVDFAGTVLGAGEQRPLLDRRTSDLFAKWTPAGHNLLIDGPSPSRLSKYVRSGYDRIRVGEAELRAFTSRSLRRDQMNNHVIDNFLDDTNIEERTTPASSEPADVYINAGGPVSILQWVPVGNANTSVSISSLPQYLLVGISGSVPGTNDALLQLYHVSDGEGIEMHLGIVIPDGGGIVDAQFCNYDQTYTNCSNISPVGGVSAPVSSLGLVAVVCSNGSMHLIVIPHPDSIQVASANPTVIRAQPVLSFHDTHHTVSTIRWHPSNPNGNYPLILAGTNQGSAMFWDIRSDNSIPELHVEATRTVHDAVTAVCWSHASRYQFAVGSHSGLIKLFDIRKKQLCLWTFDSFNPVFGLEFVPYLENTFAVASCIGIRIVIAADNYSFALPFWADVAFDPMSVATSLRVMEHPTHLILAVTTNTGVALYTAMATGALRRDPRRQRRIVELVSIMNQEPNNALTFTDSLDFSHMVSKTHNYTESFKARLKNRITLSTSNILLNEQLCMNSCAINQNLPFTEPPVVASGGACGIVRIQRLPHTIPFSELIDVGFVPGKK